MRCRDSTSAAPGRVVCLVDPVGDVYACPFAIHENFLAGNVRSPGGFHHGMAGIGVVRRPAPAADRRRLHSCSAFDACRGGCMAAKFFTGLPLDGPDPECVKGHGETALLRADRRGPRPSLRSTTRTAPLHRHPAANHRCTRLRREPARRFRLPADDARLAERNVTD